MVHVAAFIISVNQVHRSCIHIQIVKLGDGIDDVKNYLLSQAKPGKWLYPGNVWTDQNAELVILNTVKAALLNQMPQEVPYKLEPVIEYFNVDENGKVLFL